MPRTLTASPGLTWLHASGNVYHKDGLVWNGQNVKPTIDWFTERYEPTAPLVDGFDFPNRDADLSDYNADVLGGTRTVEAFYAGLDALQAWDERYSATKLREYFAAKLNHTFIGSN